MIDENKDNKDKISINLVDVSDYSTREKSEENKDDTSKS